MVTKRIVIAGTGSGVGKTTITIGIMAALKQAGLIVQGFKCGPDYIDPSYHSAVTKRVSRNLDSWMLTQDCILETYINGSQGADISVIEGVMGFFDGKSPETNEGSTAEISMITKSPVLLVVNCESMARSAAAIVKGFQLFSEGPNIVGVIANKVGSEGHYQLIKKSIEQECHVPVIGYLKREIDIEIPERQLGLIPSIERGDLDSLFDRLGELIVETIDIEQLLELATAEPLRVNNKDLSVNTKIEHIVKIAVAKDKAFNFYYPENLEMLEAKGAKIVYFSPLDNEELPEDVDGLYLGGCLPEEFAHELAGNIKANRSVKTLIEHGLPTLAECGGFMYLTESIETTRKKKYPMVGVIPGSIHMQPTLSALGYREISGQKGNFILRSLSAKGHEYHYSSYQSTEANLPFAYQTEGLQGLKNEGYLIHNVVAGYTHIHFGSCSEMVENWIEKCVEYKESRGKSYD
ncbi:cobyrinate a,c-diamide synthase [Ureibacillus acetophenoni]|uniref:cobyrinate a,c-diamide synthase n=1 Tax=Ureibacillus acetophenoni TaxID=614649 RepID=UPI000BE4125A|nr:cobyrinate a,c-diamide synthase [Ureibacillus acetophenoni]